MSSRISPPIKPTRASFVGVQAKEGKNGTAIKGMPQALKKSALLLRCYIEQEGGGLVLWRRSVLWHHDLVCCASQSLEGVRARADVDRDLVVLCHGRRPHAVHVLEVRACEWVRTDKDHNIGVSRNAPNRVTKSRTFEYCRIKKRSRRAATASDSDVLLPVRPSPFPPLFFFSSAAKPLNSSALSTPTHRHTVQAAPSLSAFGPDSPRGTKIQWTATE